MTKPLTQRTGEKKTAAAVAVDTLLNKAETPVKEKRTLHPSIAIEPSTWESFKLLAGAKNTTPNNLLCELLKDAVEQNQDKINKYLDMINS